MLSNSFFNHDACEVAQALLGKVIRRNYHGKWLAARIIETEAYYLDEKGSHASLGFTEKRKALFMPPGTIYMYYARGKDSLNISCYGDGNAVLIKSAFPHEDELTATDAIKIMQTLNPGASGQPRTIEQLCAGQTLLCTALDIKVKRWDQQSFDQSQFYLNKIDDQPEKIVQTTRLGIPQGRDEHLLYRFVDYDYAKYCTSNPLSKRSWIEGQHYHIIQP